MKDSTADWLATIGVRGLPEELVRQALTHPSFTNEGDGRGPSNQRLEFLGDAVLGLVVAQELFDQDPATGEGELTRRRAALVRQDCLANAALRMGLGVRLLVGRGASLRGDRDRPSVLAAAFEALVAAIYVEHGLIAAREFVRRWLYRDLVAVSDEPDPKTRLQEMLQRAGPAEVAYRVEDEQGPPHDRVFRIGVLVDGRKIAEGCGKSKKEAEQNAAHDAIRLLLGGKDADSAGPPAS